MHILLLTDNFPPEVNAPASRCWEHARIWVQAGHRVTVITGAPNFPQGVVYRGYRNVWSSERREGIRILRVPTFIVRNEGFVLRTADYLSFMVSGFLGGLRVRGADVLVATSPQFFTACGGLALARMLGIPFVFEVRDLWPASIAAVGAMRGGRLIALLESIELFLYRRARAVITVTKAFRADLMRRGITGRKIAVVTNGADLSRFRPQERDIAFARAKHLADAFVVGYLGTHGMAHGLDNVLAAAGRLRSESDIRFLFLGDGAAKPGLEQQAREEGLGNVVFHSPAEKSHMPSWWGLCDVALVHLRPDPVFSTVLPSKIFEAMAMGVPILFVGPPGEASELIESTGIGLCVPPADPAALADAVRRLRQDRGLILALRSTALRSAGSFDRSRLATSMARILKSVARQ